MQLSVTLINRTFIQIVSEFSKIICLLLNSEQIFNIFACQTSAYVFSKVCAGFFCQIMTDSYKKIFQSLFVFMQIEKFRLSLSFWFALPLFSLPSTCSKIVPFIEDLVVITALSHSGSFGKHFFCFRKKKVFTSLGQSVSIGKNCALCLAYGLGWYPRPQAQYLPNTDLPAGE